MAAIGGIFGATEAGFKADELMSISKAMLTRGGERKGAYINKGAGVFFGGAKYDISALPYTETRNGRNITAVIDGYAYAEDFGGKDSFSLTNSASSVIEKYASNGVKLGEHLWGEFSLALCDESRGELVLLRDGRGARPLFYLKSRERMAFASEIKGLARLVEGPMTVDADMLRRHIFSSDRISAADLYTDIYEIPPSGGCVCTRLGVSPFLYCSDMTEADGYFNRVVEEELVCPDAEALRLMLGEILFAFDYPQFDAFMPCFIRNLRERAEKKDGRFLALEDGTLCMNIQYSVERRDRLCAYYGAYVKCVPPKRNSLRERELRKFERILWQLLGESDASALNRIFGNDYLKNVEQEKNTARRIRILGMLCQTVMWLKNYNLDLVSVKTGSLSV